MKGCRCPYLNQSFDTKSERSQARIDKMIELELQVKSLKTVESSLNKLIGFLLGTVIFYQNPKNWRSIFGGNGGYFKISKIKKSDLRIVTTSHGTIEVGGSRATEAFYHPLTQKYIEAKRFPVEAIREEDEKDV